MTVGIQIMTGRIPYEGSTHLATISLQILQKSFPDLPQESPFGDFPSIAELMASCWAFEPEIRPASRLCRATVAIQVALHLSTPQDDCVA